MRRLRLDLLGVVALLAVAACVLSLPAAVWASSPLVVTTTLDSGPGSLRQAITDANATPGSTIVFNIPETDPGFNAVGGWFSIVPLTPLPTLACNGTTLDGASQTAFTGDTNANLPEIFLDGRSTVWIDPPSGGLLIQSNSTVVDGLTVSATTQSTMRTGQQSSGTSDS